MSDNRRTYTYWNDESAIREGKRYRTQHDCNHYAHGVYAYLARHDLLHKVFKNAGIRERSELRIKNKTKEK